MPRSRKALAEPYNTGNAPAVAAGQPYGQRQATERALAAVPIPGPQTAPQPQGGPPGSVDPIADAQAMAPPSGSMFAPTTQPGVPVTAGLPSGPGPGPDALGQPPNPDAAQLQSLVPLLEILASGPSSTYATRNFLRTLRSTVGG